VRGWGQFSVVVVVLMKLLKAIFKKQIDATDMAINQIIISNNFI